MIAFMRLSAARRKCQHSANVPLCRYHRDEEPCDQEETAAGNQEPEIAGRRLCLRRFGLGALARILKKKGGRYELATACVDGGQVVATIIEREA